LKEEVLNATMQQAKNREASRGLETGSRHGHGKMAGIPPRQRQPWRKPQQENPGE